jgi:hypothetical protein
MFCKLLRGKELRDFSPLDGKRGIFNREPQTLNPHERAVLIVLYAAATSAAADISIVVSCGWLGLFHNSDGFFIVLSLKTGSIVM